MGPLMADVAPGLAPGELIVRDGQRLHRLYAVNAAGKTWVFHDGVTYEIGEDAPARKRPGAHETLTAPMPATEINAKASNFLIFISPVEVLQTNRSVVAQRAIGARVIGL